MIITEKDKSKGYYVQPPLLAIGYKYESQKDGIIVTWYLKRRSQKIMVNYVGGVRSVTTDPPMDASFTYLKDFGPINQLDSGIEGDKNTKTEEYK